MQVKLFDKPVGLEDRDRLCDVKPFKKRVHPHGRQVAHDKVERLLTFCGDSPAEWARGRAMVAGMAYCGLQRSEVLALDFGHVDLGGRSLVVRDAKRDAYRWLPLRDPVVEYLRPWLTQRGDRPGPLFCVISQHQLPTHRRLSGEGVTWILGHMVGRTGVSRPSPQDLRKYFCTSLQEAGVDELLVRQLLGYVSLDTTLRYDRRSLRQAVDATWRPAAADLRLGEGRPAPYGLFEKIA